MQTTIVISADVRDKLYYLKRKTKYNTYNKLLGYLIDNFNSSPLKNNTMNRLNQIKNEANLLDINETVVELIKVYEYVNGIKVEE